MSFIYVASPYSHPDPMERDRRYEEVLAYVAECFRAGEFVYSPIVHSHEVACAHDLPTDANWWRGYNFAMLRVSARLRVLKMGGWQHSKGVAGEIDFAANAGIPMEFVEWPAA